MADRKFLVFRKGSQFHGVLYTGEMHRADCLAVAAKLSPFSEELLDNKTPIGLVAFHPFKMETDKSLPEDYLAAETIKDADRKSPIFTPPEPREGKNYLKLKFRTSGVAKSVKSKTGGNSGGVGRKGLSKRRGYGGGQLSPEAKLAREAQIVREAAARKLAFEGLLYSHGT